MITEARSSRACNNRSREAWDAIQQIFDASPAAYGRILSKIEAVLQRYQSCESALDVMAKMILRYGPKPEAYTSARIRWAVARVDSDALRRLNGRSTRSAEALEAYRRQLNERQTRTSQELMTAVEAAEIVTVLRDVVLPGLPTVLRNAMQEVIQSAGIEANGKHQLSAENGGKALSVRARQWRICQAKKLCARRLAEMGAGP